MLAGRVGVCAKLGAVGALSVGFDLPDLCQATTYTNRELFMSCHGVQIYK